MQSYTWLAQNDHTLKKCDHASLSTVRMLTSSESNPFLSSKVSVNNRIATRVKDSRCGP
eukprot:jgi/Bigna1/65470/fgenesh1_kg.110_\